MASPDRLDPARTSANPSRPLSSLTRINPEKIARLGLF
jgi:hypothetical protein